MAEVSRGEDFLFLPSRSGTATMKEIKRRISAPFRLTWGVPSMDDVIIPMSAGDLVSIIGRPSHAKSSLIAHLVRQANKNIVESGAEGHVLMATWETLVEEWEIIRLSGASGITLEEVGYGRVDVGRMGRAVAGGVGERVAVFGRSMETGGRVPTLRDLDEAVVRMSDQGRPVSVLFVDYLQRIPSETTSHDRTREVNENLEGLKDRALSWRVPIVVAVQAGRQVDDYAGVRLPKQGDGQHTSAIEQTSDKIFGITRPIMYMADGTILEDSFTGMSHRVTPALLAVALLKQRWGKVGMRWMLDFDPKTIQIQESVPYSSPF